MKAKPVDLNIDTLNIIRELSTEYLSDMEGIDNVESKIIQHHSMGHRLLIVAFDFIGDEGEPLERPIYLQFCASQLQLKTGIFSKQDYFFLLFQENELKPRVYDRTLYQPQEILVDKFNSSPRDLQKALMAELLSESIGQSLVVWSEKAKAIYQGRGVE